MRNTKSILEKTIKTICAR